MQSLELLSIIDKLIDDDPEKKSERQKSPHELFSEVKSGIRRDLENLLNTKIDWRSIPDNCTQLDVSLVNYGLPDFTSTNLSAKQTRMEFIEVIEEAISKYETRFERVEVELDDDNMEVERNLKFNIRALIKWDASAEVIAYSTSLDPINRTITLDSMR